MKTKTLLTASLIFLVSCSTSSTASIESTSTTFSVPTTINTDPQAELDRFADSLNAVDYSRIAESKCGKFALVVQKTKIRFYEWSSNIWMEQSELLGKDGFTDPYLVTTHDYTGDGVNDFLVSYNKDGQQGGHEFGGVFLQIDCQWQWAKFKGYYDTSETLDLLTYEKSTKALTAWGDGPGGRADVVLTFNTQSNEFDSQTLSADDAGYGSEQASQPQQTQSNVSVVGVRCKDGLPLSSGCYAVLSNGQTRGIDGLGPWTGSVVASTEFSDSYGNRICVLMYSNGRGKSSYC
jgi:hypothetical protein